MKIGRFTWLTPAVALLFVLALTLSQVNPAAAAPGDIDPTFGGAPAGPAPGKVFSNFGASSEGSSSMLRQPDGKMVLAGARYFDQLSLQWVIARYNPDGSLDSSFSGDGWQTTDIGSGYAVIQALALQSDGKIVAAGYSTTSTEEDFTLARYNADGSLDTNFGTGGTLVTSLSPTDDQATALAVQPNGQIVVGGFREIGGNDEMIVVRLNAASGSFDALFGVAGIAHIDFSNTSDQAQALALQTDGNIVVAGHAGDDFALARLNSVGFLDNSFGVSGKQVTDFAADVDGAFAVAVQTDGKIVAAGQATGSNVDFALARYNSNGVLDNSFSADGKLTSDFGAPYDQAVAIAIQADGKLLAGGISQNANNSDFALSRYNTDGTPDSTFGNGGLVTTNLSGEFDWVGAITVLPNGTVISAGYTVHNNSEADFALTRHNPNGSLDFSFDGDGKLLSDFNNTADVAVALVRQSDGKLIGVGAHTGGNHVRFVVARYNAAGVLDPTFANSGHLLSLIKGTDLATGVALQPDGYIVVTGQTATAAGGPFDFALLRYKPDGSPDAGFGINGQVVTDLGGSETAPAVALQPDGKILLAGSSVVAGNSVFALVRYLANGDLDGGFGTGGVVTTPFGSDAHATAMALLPNGTILVAGSGKNGANSDFALARYTTSGALDSSFSADGKLTTDFGGTADGATDLALLAGGRFVAVGQTNSGTTTDVALARYNANGTLDNTFGSGGKVTTDFAGKENRGAAIVALADGRLVVSSFGSGDFLVALYNADGSPSNSFGGADGYVETDFAAAIDFARALLVQPDGKIVVAGAATDSAGLAGFGLTRYQAPAPLPTKTPTATPSRTSTATPSRTLTRTRTATPTKTATRTITVTRTKTPTKTATGTPSRTPTATVSRTPTKTRTVTPTKTTTRTVTATRTSTATPTVTATKTKTITPTKTASKTATGTPSRTPTKTKTGTPTKTRTATLTVTVTKTKTITPTKTATKTATATPSWTPTGTASRTPTKTKTATATKTPTHAASVTKTPTRTSTPGGTASTPSATKTPGGAATVTATSCAVSFTDVHPTDYFYEPVLYLACQGAISGYGDGTFRPFNNVTRGQLAKIIVGAEGWALATTGGPHFADVAANNTFYSFIETAFSHDVISGYGDGTFRPANIVTRGQLAKIIAGAESWTLLNPPTPSFVDVATNNPFYRQIETAVAHGIISGYDLPGGGREFRWGNNATRGQISKIVYLAVATPIQLNNAEAGLPHGK